jgi:hypothetical protein
LTMRLPLHKSPQLWFSYPFGQLVGGAMFVNREFASRQKWLCFFTDRMLVSVLSPAQKKSAGEERRFGKEMLVAGVVGLRL